MKPLSNALGMLALTVSLAAVGHAQLTPPPIKMGLWRTNSTVTLSGAQLPPQIAAALQARGGQPATSSALSCLTPEKWQSIFNPKKRDQKCEFTNQKQTAAGMSADIVCTGLDSRVTKGHFDATFENPEKISGTIHIESPMQSQQQLIIMDNKFDGTFQGADCKGISPDSPR